MAKSSVARQKSKSSAVPKELGSLKGWDVLRHVLKADGGVRWGLPATGGYGGGCESGGLVATAYLKFLRESPERQMEGCLQNIAIDMLSDHSVAIGSSASESLRGQAVGFFSQIDSVLKQCVALMANLDTVTFDTLVKDIDTALTNADGRHSPEHYQKVRQHKEAQHRIIA